MNLSVLLSVYYKEKASYLKESLNSLINQTHLPNEIVIVKDGPLTSELEQALQAFCEEHKKTLSIKLVSLKKKHGLGPALSIGLMHCSNNIVARMDADDICLPTRFEKQLEILEKHPEIAIVGTNIEEYDENMSKKISEKKCPETSAAIKKYLKKRNPFNHMSVMYRKDSILEVGNYEKMDSFEDYFLWFKVLARYDGYNIQENLMLVRAGKEMIARRGGAKYLKHIFLFERKLFNHKYLTVPETIINILIRSIVAIVPSGYRNLIYRGVLR